MKKLLFILLLTTKAWADCPLWTYPENHKLDSEINNLCQNQLNPVFNVASGSTMTITQLNVSTISISGTPTNANDAVKFSQLKYLQTILSSSTAATTSTSTSFVDTVLKRNITPSSVNSKVLVMAQSEIGGLVAGKSAFITIARNGTDLSGGSGFNSDILVNASGAFRQPWSAVYLDAPATTSAVSYTIQIKTVAAGGVNLNDNSGVATMLLCEVQ